MQDNLSIYKQYAIPLAKVTMWVHSVKRSNINLTEQLLAHSVRSKVKWGAVDVSMGNPA